MRADRDKRAAILTAEGARQAQILRAEGEKQAAVLQAEGEAQAAVLRADGEAAAIRTVFEAIHEGDADQKLLAYQYLQTLPELAKGDSNKLWIIPSEVGDALKGLGGAFTGLTGGNGANGNAAAPTVSHVPVDPAAGPRPVDTEKPFARPRVEPGREYPKIDPE